MEIGSVENKKPEPFKEDFKRIKENLKRGWAYALISIFIYYFLTLVPGLVGDFDIYFLIEDLG